jgi:hypothetical protein
MLVNNIMPQSVTIHRIISTVHAVLTAPQLASLIALVEKWLFCFSKQIKTLTTNATKLLS